MSFEREILSAILGKSANATGWIRVDCPFCADVTGKSDHKGSLAVSATTGRYACWKCAEKGRVDVEWLADVEIPAVVESTEPAEPPEQFIPLYEGDGATSVMLLPARKYLVERLGKDTKRIVHEARIGACVGGKQAGRIVVPVFGADGTTWEGWVARDWTNTRKLRYVYPAGMARTLFNRHQLQREHELVFVTEGVFDAFSVWPGVVSCLGKPNQLQVDVMLTTKNPLVIALDGDAWEEGWALQQRLRFQGRQDVGFVRLPPKTDPATVPNDWLWDEARKSLRI